jgi:2-oxoglutarate dehydrogenase E2 component (dihydrolipoamide succinyltransferase)
MRTELKLVAAGMGMSEATVTQWFSAVGDQVKRGDPLVEVEAEKVTVTIESPYEGVLMEIVADVDDTLQVGDVYAVMDTAGE